MNYRAIIAFLGTQQQKHWVNNKSSLIQTVGFANYTPEVMAELGELFDAGDIESRPTIETGYYGASIKWVDKDGQTHRGENLPALEGDPSSKNKGKLLYRVHGADHRTDGPASVTPDSKRIEWWLDDTRIAFVNIIPSRKSMEIWEDSASTYLRDVNGWKQYRDLIKQKFPEAGDKIWPWDYMSVKPLPQKTINEWKQQIGV